MLGGPPPSRLPARTVGDKPISCVERCTQRSRPRYGRLSARIVASRQKRVCCIKVKASSLPGQHWHTRADHQQRPSLESSRLSSRRWCPKAVLAAASMKCINFTTSVESQITTSRRRDDEYDYIRWCFKDLPTAEAFAAQFSGTLILTK
jgi:hypothetical protein